MRTDLDEQAIAAVLVGEDMERLLDEIGAEVARDADVLAPKRTGAGAKSIHQETGIDARGPYVRVSWDRLHFYMGFAELGDSRQKPTPFLRPALFQYRSNI